MSGPASLPVWGPFIRIFHWSLAVAVVTNYWFTEGGSDLHVWIGYAASLAVLARIAGGLAGRGHARFDSCPVNRETIREHVLALRQRNLPPDSGHNPLGALMIYLMFLLIAILAISGTLHEQIDALYGDPLLQGIHAFAAQVLWVCAMTHVAAVFLVQALGRIQLVRPMITGYRQLRNTPERPEDRQ
ncbi:cytochrome b/b6 domain-containing protein [Haliea atlantica]